MAAELSGFRTIFSAFHHLRPDQARAVLQGAVARGEGIGVFECADRNPLILVLGALTTPIRVLLTAPFIQPFRWSRLFWTYLVPLLPLVLAFDVVVSCLRFLQRAGGTHEATAGLDSYQWNIGTLRGKPALIRITYLIGVPLANAG